MEKQRSVKVMAIVALLLAVVGVSVAFAAMSETLNIGGAAEMDTATWKIKFQGIAGPTIVGQASEVEPPELNGDTTIEAFKVLLTKPGDTISYTFNVVNGGSLDAEISSITKASPVCTGKSSTLAAEDAIIVCENFTYTLTYTDDGENVEVGDELASGVTKNLTLTLSYDGETLPSDDVAIDGLALAIIYVQD